MFGNHRVVPAWRVPERANKLLRLTRHNNICFGPLARHPILTVGPKSELVGAKYFELGEYYRSTLGKTDPSQNTILYSRNSVEN
eukprot:SAG31_NODE_28195_length_414_cov_0.800000_1_plen_83_part_10